MTQIINITNPANSGNPADGDILQYTYENGAVDHHQFHIPPTATETARAWRDQELRSSDWISQTPDHPQRAAYLTFRTALRDWPADADNFPGTKPELG
jgi:hypothetical protein